MKINTVKFLAISDTHGRPLPNIDSDTDGILCAGDFCNYEEEANILFGSIANMNIPLFFVTGNHESIRIANMLTTKHNIFCLDCKQKSFRNMILTGVQGYDIFDSEREKRLEYFAMQTKKENKDSERFSVFISHEPPFPWRHECRIKGSEGVKNVIKSGKYNLVLSGHFHEEKMRTESDSQIVPVAIPGNGGIYIEINKENKEYSIRDAFRFDSPLY